MRRLFRDAEHLFRMAGLFVVGTAAFFVVRAALVPDDFGLYGHYRAGAIAEATASPLRYAGREVCEGCHVDVVEARAGAAHERIGCESCHGPLADHAEDPSSVSTALPRSGMLCVNCHASIAARPDWMPGVDPDEHSGGVACSDCHAPHAPGFD